MRLVDKYRPKTLDDIWGQSWTVHQLKLWAEAPASAAFVFSGGTGTGKTSAAIALAADLGVAVDADEMGGLWQIASGSQTGETVRQAIDNLRVSPWQGSGWKMLLVNEADCMTPNASYAWLDILEGNNLPVKTVVVFTTNEARKLARRLIDRCEHYAFESGALILRPELQRFAAHVWQLETGRDDCPEIDAFGPVGDENAEASFRRLLQQMEPAIRSAKAGQSVKLKDAPKSAAVPQAAGTGTLIERALAVLATGPKPTKELAAALGKKNISSTLFHIVRSGKAKAIDRGVYSLT